MLEGPDHEGLPRRRTRKRWMIMMVMDEKTKEEIERRSGKSIDDMNDYELEEAREEISKEG